MEYGNLCSTNHFVFNGKLYPFNMNLFKLFSGYFKTHKDLIQPNGNINLNDFISKNDILSEDYINDFIKFLFNQKITINKENLHTLLILARTFDIGDLIKLIIEFISNNPNEYVIYLLTMETDHQILKSEQCENIITTNLTSYIKNDDLLNLPIPTLHRIISKFFQNSQNQSKINEIMPFLFKCLDKHGKKASILFDNVDFENVSSDLMNKLIHDYDKIHDIEIFNKSYLRVTCEIKNEIYQKLKKIEDENIQYKNEIEKMKKNQRELEKQINEQKLINDKLTSLRFKVRFQSLSNLKGIISYLGDSVILRAGGHHDKAQPLSNIKKKDDSYFYNYFDESYKYKRIEPRENNWIEFDLGESNKIHLYSYLIRSNCNAPSVWYHPKTWSIKGSNDQIVWDEIDRCENDEHLNGKHYQHNFICKSNNSNKYRFIRYIQEESYVETHPFNIYITFFELFGEI